MSDTDARGARIRLEAAHLLVHSRKITWMPACAGMTLAVMDALSTFVIPAKAGNHATLSTCRGIPTDSIWKFETHSARKRDGPRQQVPG